MDVTLVRVLWVVLTLFPMPSLGLLAYIIAWIVMPKDPVALPVTQTYPAN
jgi:phage shock protein C